MISTLKSPDNFSPARNKVEFKLEGSNFSVVAGSKASGTLEWNNTYPNDGDTLKISFGGQDYIFTFRTEPNSLMELSRNQAPGPTFVFAYEWWHDCMFRINRVYDIAQNYELSFSSAGLNNGTISFLAREKGSAHNLVFDVSDITNTPVSETDVDGVNPTFNPNYLIRLQVFIEQTPFQNDFIAPEGSSKDKRPDENSRILTSIHDILRPYFSEDIPKLSPVAINTSPGMMIRYYVRAGEYYGAPASMKDFYSIPGEGSIKHAIDAGVGKEKEYLDFFSDHFIQQNAKFLTHAPRTQTIHKEQPIFLYAYGFGGDDQKVTLNLYYDDNTSEEIDTLLTAYQGNSYILALPAGYTQLDIDSLKTPGKEVLAYDFTFARQNSMVVYSETFHFQVNQEHYQENHFFQFRNSLGAFDSLWCAGDVIKSTEASHSTIEKKVDNTNVTVTVVNSLRKSNTEFNRIREFDTNFRDKDYIEYLEDLLGSERIFKVENGKLHEGYILTDKGDLGNSSTYENSFSFEFVFGREVGL